MLDTYRTAYETCSKIVLTADEQKKLQALHQTVLDRAVDAEFLGLTQEEYIILTKEAFWPKRYFEITLKKNIENKDYRANIGVKEVHEYYGYATEADMLSVDEDPNTGQKGLTFVKKQFLPRTGIQYTDLVELLKTRFINPLYPQGQALVILESIRFSYRFLQRLVDTSKTDKKNRFAKLIAFLETTQPLLPLLDAKLHPDPCKQQQPDHCAEISSQDLKNWVYCYFDQIGKLIVLESGEGPQLPIEGEVYASSGNDGSNPQHVGSLRRDGTICDVNNAIIGYVAITIGVYKADNGEVVASDGTVIGPLSGSGLADNSIVPVARPIRWIGLNPIPDVLMIKNNNEPVGAIQGNTLFVIINRSESIVVTNFESVALWSPARDTCDLDKVRLTHLDGTPLTAPEYDCIHRFIRLWRKLGWSIDETDKALVGVASSPSAGSGDGGTPGTPEKCDYINFDAFKDDCPPGSNGDDEGCDNGDGQGNGVDCPEFPQFSCDILPAFLHQLVAIRKLLDLTGLPLIKLLTFWTDISTAGEKSLYARLFLTHNLLGIDKVFKPDANGNYLTQTAKITEHLPVIMAALSLKADDITAIMNFRQLPDALTLPNVSTLYRHSLLAKILHVRMMDLFEVIALFGDPFTSAWSTLALLETWGKMEDAGFTFRQLNYLIRNHDDPLRPLAPSEKTILQLTKILYDGLSAIDHDHPDVSENKKDEATADLVRTKAGLLFEQSVVAQILGLLEGTTIYTTNAPANLTLTIPDDLANKLKYNNQKEATPPTASIQVTGILTNEEATKAKALSSNLDWAKAIDRVGKQALRFFNDVLFGIFAQNRDDAIENLLAGDINVPPDPQNPAATDANTAPVKRFYFLKYFLAFLRQRLAQRFIIETLSGTADLAVEITGVLLSDILTVGAPPKPAMSALENIKNNPSPSSSEWNGYLIPSVDDSYTFIAIGDAQPTALVIDGQSIPFPHQQEDPSNVWLTDPVKLQSGTLYPLKVAGRSVEQLQWKTATAPKATIPSSALLPNYASQGTEEVFTKLTKAALLINGFNLSVDEVSYWQAHAADFDSFDLNAVTLPHWQRLQAYTDLRNNLPRFESTLLDLFQWAGQPGDAQKLSEKIAATTGWKQENIEKLITADHFDLDRPEAFKNEINLVKLRSAIEVAGKIGMDIDRLFEWAQPGTKFWACHQIAEDIRKAIRARFDQEDWEQVVKPLNDQLREHQKQALISYLLVQPDLINWGVVDADSLFEFFLIDVQMDACMETSRIKQAISSVQLFVQRCFLGLEDRKENGKQVGVSADILDRNRWEWMQRYRVWEANRKVFLYPENWIEPQLRDDKSPFYKELESELLQKDISPQTVQDALKSYLFKVDEVANLKVMGLFLEQDVSKDGEPVYIKLHVFSRTRNAPYFFYYRYFQVAEKNWYPWEKMQLDISSYDVEDASSGKILENGTYLIPVVWNKRLLVFFPQFMKKTSPTSPVGDRTFQDIGNNTSPVEAKPNEYWEIKMAWSEYRNGKWTQKQVSSQAIYDPDPPQANTPLPDINLYEFIPRLISGDNPKVAIDIYYDQFSNSKKGFNFIGSQLSYGDESSPSVDSANQLQTDFHYRKKDDQITYDHIHSLQSSGNDNLPFFTTGPYFKDQKIGVLAELKFNGTTDEVYFYHPFVHELLGKLTAGDLDDLFDYYLEYYKNHSDQQDEIYGGYTGADKAKLFNELKRAYSIYNWEAGFHAPMLCVDRLLNSQQFEQAIKMCHYVFNPLATTTDTTDDKPFWQFPPFKEIDAKQVLEKLFLSLQPGQPNDQISEWRDNPFQPHVIARSRPVAYMKWVVMKYIKILIAWGGYLFRQDTIETLNQATQLYILAAHLYGPRGQTIPKRGKVVPQTYKSLLDKWDAFGNAMVELELAFPFSNQTPFPIGVSNGVVGLANIFGFATTLYFCIPDNPQLTDLRDTIDDRLFKLRHCQNIKGVFRQLPLFEPPIDPGLLVQAAAQGLSLASVLNDLNSPMPNYRFYYLLQKALELCSELKALGNSFLSTKEKGDGEALSRLRAKHESSIQNLVMEVKKQQLEESQKSLESLQQSRKSPDYRLRHYLNLIGEDTNKVPADVDTDFAELADKNEPPVDESGLKLIPFEKEEMDKAGEAQAGQSGIGTMETLASIMNMIPNLSVNAEPIGVGASISFGGSNLGAGFQAIARQLQIASNDLSYQSTNAGRKSGFLRQLQDRIQQANVAGYEIKNIDKQILTQQIRINIANQEITTQQKQIDNAQEVEEFLRNKYTNQELYTWMEGQLCTLYHQAYTLAYDLAKKAEKAFRFERGLTTSNFIQFGYWDTAYDGLLAGERLYIGLKQLEAAYQEQRGYDFEVSKPVSLRQFNPLALIELKETGSCEFTLPEILFDMDYPGHYLRRIKTVALTIPCVVGPYTTVNCTLRLLEHKFRTSAIAKDKNDYPEKTDETDERFSTTNVPLTAIAVSTGQNDSGVFELNFQDERYLPFEGAGAISKWRLELPKDFRQFDYDTISDIVIQIRYTALDGGDKLKKSAADSVQEYIKSVEQLSRQEGLFAAFDLRHEFPNAWYKAMQPPAGATERILTLNNLYERLPIFTKGRKPEKIQATDVYLFTPSALPASALVLTQDTDELTFTEGPDLGMMKSFTIKDISIPITNWELKIEDTEMKIDSLWLVVRYVLK